MTLGEATKVWLRIGLLSFGGPAGQIALMHDELVHKRKWISEERFLHALSFCTLLPGPEAQQLATYIGWLMHRTPGALVAGGLFVLPGALVLLVLSALYAQFRRVFFVEAVFFGLKAAVVALVLQALIRIGRRALTSRLHVAVALATFVALFLFGVPFPVVVLTAGVLGLLLGPAIAPKKVENKAAAPAEPTYLDTLGPQPHHQASLKRTLSTAALWLGVWWVPLGLVAAAFGARSIFAQQGVFFSEAAMVTFGGAYAVLSYVSRQAVEVYGWLKPGQMVDGLGLAETTPGPLILVLQFVGFVGAFQHPGSLPPLLAGTLGALITLWATFMPCFLWILVGAPWIEAVRGNVRLSSGLSLITAAVVGVIAELSFRFTVLTTFGMVATVQVNAMRLLVPIGSTVQWRAVALCGFALLLLFRARLGLGWVLALCALGGLGLRALH
jgi:chromate transporter